MPIRHLIAAVGAALIGLTSQSIAADFYALSDNGRTISLVDIDSSKVIKSAELAKADQLTTIAYSPESGEIWGLTTSKSFVRMKTKNFNIIFRSDPIKITLKAPFLECISGKAYIVVSNELIAVANSDGAVEGSFPAFKTLKGDSYPTLAAFTFVTNRKEPSSELLYGIDAIKNRLLVYRSSGGGGFQVWLNGPELGKKVSVPTAFEAIRESGNNKAFAVLGNALWNVNLTNGQFTKPREIKGLVGDVTAITFVTEPVVPPEMSSN